MYQGFFKEHSGKSKKRPQHKAEAKPYLREKWRYKGNWWENV
jgi:hypothetical protein